jgi:hypothetical protein
VISTLGSEKATLTPSSPSFCFSTVAVRTLADFSTETLVSTAPSSAPWPRRR